MIVLSPPVLYAPAFRFETPLGTVIGRHIPATPTEVPEDVLAALHPDERTHALTRRAFRQVQFVGGRLALGEALGALGQPRVAVLPDQQGAPALPAGLTGSVSHTRRLAAAIVAPGSHGLGLDIEDSDRPMFDIASHVLCDDERHAAAGLDEPQRWLDLVTRFSIKESVYKALHRFVVRDIGFHDVAVWPDGQGGARVDLRFDAPGPYRVGVLHTRVEHLVLSIVEVRAVET